MEEPHLKFHRILISQPSNSEAVRAEEVLERINQVNGYIHRLIQAYHLALQQIGQLKQERDLLKLERHLLAIELAKFHERDNHGYNFNTISPQTQEKQPPANDRGGESGIGGATCSRGF